MFYTNPNRLIMKIFFASVLILLNLQIFAQAGSDMSYLKKDGSVKPVVLMNNLSKGYFEDIGEAYKNKDLVKYLNLQNQNFGVLPPEVLEFKNLQVLDVSFNQLTDLPIGLASLNSLTELYINKNSFNTIPDVVYNLQGLKVLNIGNNPIIEIPARISKLTNLEKLVVEGMPVDFKVTEEVGNMASLKSLYLIYSHLDVLPFNFSKLNKLEVLCLNGNNLTTLDDNIFNLKNLNYLSFGGNKISVIPSSIKNLQKLQYLGIFENPVSIFPSEIYSLNSLNELSCWKTNIPIASLENKAKFRNSKIIELHTSYIDAH